MTDSLVHPIAERALEAIRRARHEGEVFLEEARASRVVVSGGKIEALEVRQDRGASVRVFDRGHAGFAFTADLSDAGLETMVSRAVEIASLVAADPANRLPSDPGPPATDIPLLDPTLTGLPMRRKIEAAMAAEEAARGADRRISGVRESSYQDVSSTVHLANTAGLSIGYAQSRAFIAVELAASEAGASQTGWHADWRLGFDGLDPALVGREAARKATVKLGAAPAETRRTTVVLSPETTASLFGELSALFFADAVLRGRSLLDGKMNEMIASERVTLTDDGRHPAGYASAPVDGEGVGTRETVLIDRGTLRGYLHSTYTASRMETPLTGNALRGGYASRPGISRTNLYLRPTGVSETALLRDVSDGIYVMELMGLHTINSVTGDFSLGATGLTIESGHLGTPVDRMAIAGNILGLLGSIEAVADDLQFLLSGAGSTVLLRDLAVSGR